jgi:hypothetical protein
MDYLQDALFHVSQNIHRQLLVDPATRTAEPQPLNVMIERVEAMRCRRDPSLRQGILDLKPLQRQMSSRSGVQ